MTIERRTSFLGKHLKTHVIVPPQEIRLKETWAARKTLKVLSDEVVQLVEMTYFNEHPKREPLVKEEINQKKIRRGLIFRDEFKWHRTVPKI